MLSRRAVLTQPLASACLAVAMLPLGRLAQAAQFRSGVPTMSLLPTPRQFAVDGNGAPLAGAAYYFFESGTSTPLAVFADSSLSTAHPQPVTADGAGLWPAIYLSPADYKVELRDADGATVWTQDPVTGLLTVNGDGSAVTVKADGATVARPQAERAGDAINIKDHGAKADGAAVATAAFTTATAAAAAAGWVAHLPPGLYDLTGNPPGLPNVGYDMTGVRFVGLEPAYPDWIGDPTFYTGPQPRSWRALEGAVDRHDGQFGQYVGMRVLDTSSGGTNPSDPYMKGAGYFKTITHDKSGQVGASDPDTVTRDAVALTGAGTIAAGNTLGRAWSLFAHSICEAGADGLLAGLEIDMGNFSGNVQKAYNAPTTKTAVRLFATGHISCGIHFSNDQSGAVANSRWHHAISIEPTALDSDGYAFRLIGNMVVRSDGRTAIGAEDTRAGYLFHVEAASGNAKQIIKSNGTNIQTTQTFMSTGAAWTCGFSNITNTPFRLSKAENLDAPNFEWNEYGNFAVGGSVPAGFGSNGLHIKAGTAPWLSPGTGFVLYVDSADGNKLKAMSPTGIVTTLAV